MIDKDRILKEFSALNCIIDFTALEQYVDYCITKNQMVKCDSSTHHILPMAKTLPFQKFSCLKKNPWNAAELSYFDHYKAHFLLAKAINHIAVSTAFIGMHSKDKTLNRITETDLVEENEFLQLYKNRNQLLSEHRKELIETEIGFVSRGKYWARNRITSAEARLKLREKILGENNIVHKEGVVEKIRKSKSSKIIDGKNMDTISAERAAETMKTVILIDNQQTTIYNENAKKQSKTLNEKIEVDGVITSKAIIYGKERSLDRLIKGEWYSVKSVFDETYDVIMPKNHIRFLLSADLTTKTKENYLGKSKYGYSRLTKSGKSNLIGLYVLKCEPDQQYRIQYLENNPIQ